jgi:predicted Zn-dependent protease
MYKVLQIAEILHLADLEPTATKWMESAFQLDPDDNFTQVPYAQKLWYAGDTELATSVLVNKHEREKATVDSLLLLALISMQAKDLAKALEATSHAVQLSPNSVYSQSLHYWLLKTHFDDDASSPQLESFGEQHWPNQYVARSIMHLAERQKGAAIDALRTAAELGYLDYQYLLYAMPFQQLKDEPDFQSIIDDIMHSVSTERTKIQAMQLPDINVLMQAE